VQSFKGMKLGKKFLSWTNTLVYLSETSATMKKCFTASKPKVEEKSEEEKLQIIVLCLVGVDEIKRLFSSADAPEK
jgi:hypothetical protein